MYVGNLIMYPVAYTSSPEDHAVIKIQYPTTSKGVTNNHHMPVPLNS